MFNDPQQVPRMVAPGTFVRAQFPHATPRTINPEMSRQLRDLLQRQQLKTKLETDRPWTQGKTNHIVIKPIKDILLFFMACFFIMQGFKG